MTVTRQQAIKIIDKATDTGHGFDDWWADLMDEFGLYDEKADTFPSLYDVLKALGVSREECKAAWGL